MASEIRSGRTLTFTLFILPFWLFLMVPSDRDSCPVVSCPEAHVTGT